MGESMMRAADMFYRLALRPLFFTLTPDTAHNLSIRSLAVLDRMPALAERMSGGPVDLPASAGGVTLASPVMVAAGLVKGYGYKSEEDAVTAARRTNIIPGWRSVPLMCGTVEFGSFTRFPRLGNPGPVLWRDIAGRSTQNRVGLRNPGALAAATFLGAHTPPRQFGISIATTPGESDPAVQAEHVSESIRLILTHAVNPSWFTINLSCPNTEDDPLAYQTADLAERVCKAAVSIAGSVPVWVKIGPALSDAQYTALVDVIGQTGIRAVVATNTLPAKVKGSQHAAGLGGALLYERSLGVVLKIFAMRERHGHRFDIVGCGGIMDGTTARAYTDAGASALQLWSALVYRGPFAAAHVAREYAKLIGR